MIADRSKGRPVADLLARVSSLLVISHTPSSCRSATSFGPVCDQDSVMEFGLYNNPNSSHGIRQRFLKFCMSDVKQVIVEQVVKVI